MIKYKLKQKLKNYHSIKKISQETFKLGFFFILTILVFFSYNHFSKASIPDFVNYQGRLRDNFGNPITTPVTIQFSLYNHIANGSSSDAPSAIGPLLWTETYDGSSSSCQQITPGTDGIFAKHLGDCVPFPPYLDFTQEYYLGIKIGSDDEAVPRVPLSTHPYAFVSKRLHVEGGDLYITNSDPTGNIVINTAGGISVTGSNSSFPGIVYDSNYSTNYINRSLVDKEYVDNTIMSLLNWNKIAYDGTNSTVYGGDTLVPTDSMNVKGLVLENHNNGINTIRLYNNNDIDNYSGSALVLKGSGADFRNQLYFGIFGNNFYQTPFQNAALLKARDKDLFIGTHSDISQSIKFFSNINNTTYEPDLIGTFNSSGVYFNSLQSLSTVPANGGVIMSDLTTGKLVTVDPGNFSNIYMSNGELTSDRTMNILNHSFTINGAQYSYFKLDTDDSVGLYNYNSYVKTTFPAVKVHSEAFEETTDLVVDTNSLLISSTAKSFPGITYDKDYSENYKDRSLVDKAYVDNLVFGGASPFILNENVISNGDGNYSTDDFVFGSPSLGDDGNNAHDKRFFFDKSKGAFRAGYTISNEWDSLNVGDGSIALGSGFVDGEGNATKGPIASGNSAIALGRKSFASGTSSLAGPQSNAIGVNSVSMGVATANGTGSVALGHSITNGVYAFASGYNTVASGFSAVSLGNFNNANGEYSVSMGYGNTADGHSSITLGYHNTTSGDNSASMGVNNISSGNGSVTLGSFVKARSIGEVVVGLNSADYTPNDDVNYNSHDRLFVIGNGVNISNPSNAFVMLKDGSATLSNVFEYTADLSATYTDRSLVDKKYVDDQILANSSPWIKNGHDISPAVAGDNLLLGEGESLFVSDMAVGSIPFFTTNGLMTQDNNNLYWDWVDNRLGIGTAAPNAKLHVAGQILGNDFAAISGTAISPAYKFGGDVDTGLFSVADNEMGFSTGGNERVRIDANGNVGIGDANPGYKLTIGGGALMLDSVVSVPASSQGYAGIYTQNGELYAFDENGNSTQISPHNKDGFWWYNSVNARTGKSLQIEMELLTKELNKILGGGYIKENGQEIDRGVNLLDDLKLKTDSNIQTLTELQKSVDNNLDVINQTLIHYDKKIINVNEKEDDFIRENREKLTTLSENVNSLTELTTILTDTLEDYEKRIVGLEVEISQLQSLNNVDNSENLSNSQFPILSNISKSLENFGQSLRVLKQENENVQFTLDGALVVKKLETSKIKSKDIYTNYIDTEKIVTKKVVTRELVTDESVGRAIIRAGKKQVKVEAEIVDDDSYIMLTPYQAVSVGLTKIEKGLGFTIEIDKPLEDDLNIDWFVIKKKDAG